MSPLTRRQFAMSALPALAGQAPHDPRKRLLLDSRVTGQMENARLEVGAVEKEPRNPLFGEDKPWEVSIDNLYANVLYDEEEKIYKCWYNPFIYKHKHNITPPGKRRRKADYRSLPGQPEEQGVCYAFSRDGLTWVKPELGLVEFNGSKRNNLVARAKRGPQDGRPIDTPAVASTQSSENWNPHGSGVWKDLREKDPARRYKMFFSYPRKYLCVSFSADGIHWADPISCPKVGVRGDTHNNAFWAPTLNRYVGITRMFDDKAGQRLVARTESPDFVDWGKGVEILRALPGETRRQTYTLIAFPYANVYLGWLMMLNRDQQYRPDDPDDDTVDCELVWSPDTVKWERVCPGSPVIPRGKEGAPDFGCVYGAAYPILRGGKLLLYYGGSDWKHTDWRVGTMCLARMRPDGFAGIAPVEKRRPAVVRTHPLPCAGPALYVTADARGGSVRADVFDPEGRRLASSKPVRADVTGGRVDFGKWSAAEHAGKPLRLDFTLESAKLYAFSWGG